MKAFYHSHPLSGKQMKSHTALTKRKTPSKRFFKKAPGDHFVIAMGRRIR